MSDQWEFYPTRVDDEAASIYVNLSYRDAAPIESASDLIWLRLYFLHPRDDGLSSQEEFQTLCEIEDAMERVLEDSGLSTYYVGRNTSGGSRDFYFYSGNGQETEETLKQAMVRFPDYEYETGHRTESDWSAYLEFLFPSPRDMQLIKNQHVITSLNEHDDQLDVPREVAHWAYFPEENARNTFVTRSQSLGFALRNSSSPESSDDPWGATVTRVDPVDYWSIADATLALHDLAIELGGEYDGWETPVVKDRNGFESPN